jgi:hypothetical protein
MLLCYYMFRPYKAIFRQTLVKDSNSLYAKHIVTDMVFATQQLPRYTLHY